MPKKRFFRCEDYFQKGIQLYCIITPRNIGKTTALIQRGVDKYRATGGYFVILRNSGEEVKSYLKSGNNIQWWKDTHGLTRIGNGFYDVWDEKIKYTETNAKGVEVEKERTITHKKIVCVITSLSTYHNLASNNFDNLNMIFFEEFHSRSTHISLLRDDYVALAEILFTMERMNHIELWMATNYIKGILKRNIFLTRWGIKDGIKVQEILGGKGLVILTDHNDYKPRDYKNSNSLAYEFAKYDPEYLRASTEGGFIDDGRFHILYPSEYKNYQHIQGYALATRLFDIGHADYKGKKVYIIKHHDPDNPLKALELNESLENSIPKVDAENMVEIAEELSMLIPLNKVWFTSLQLEQTINNFCIRMLGKY